MSIAQIQFLAIDNTHTKYLKGADKKAWNNYKEAYEANKKMESFMKGFNVQELDENGEYEIPVRRTRGQHKNNNKKQ